MASGIDDLALSDHGKVFAGIQFKDGVEVMLPMDPNPIAKRPQTEEVLAIA